MREFKMTIVLGSSLAVGTYPADMISLALPEQDGACGKVAFLPQVQLVQLDQGTTPVSIVAGRRGDWISTVQQFYGQQTIARLRREMELSLRGQSVPESLTKDSTAREADVRAAVASFVASSGVERVYVLGDSPATAFGGASVASSSSVEEIGRRIAASLCVAERRREALPPVMVLYRPPMLARDGPAAAPAGGGEGERSALPEHEPIPEDDAATILLASLIERGRTTSRTGLKAIDAAFKEAQEQHPHDYRFSYERAALAIYGVQAHHEAFRLLYHAAEIAIVNDEAADMLETATTDANEEGRFHKLAHGHGEWREMLRALKTRDAALVRR